ncbi:acyltransferase-domain-containing protein [Lentinus brumalis]|uniref:Tafazzin family protein n=1 Tax=Lentinus brumalis TaxID=2498619 RepID=A0A371DE15_9APHY|nr:acyltransferase-domain-containing protein [Polyporus brumalis]
MSLLSQVTVSAVGLFSKALLNVGFCSSVTVKGLDNLVKALEDEERNNGRGIVTNDPVVWGVLPARFYRDSRKTRWTLGASDIMFTNPVFSTFFRYGQVIETFRGRGIFQPAIDTAIEKLNRGEWIHLFSEGKVNQDSSDLSSPNAGRLLRFKWGIGRIIMEAQRPPVIIPMWLTGFDKLMPEGRSAPFKFFPRPGAVLSITFGKPVPSQEIQDTLQTLIHERRIPDASSYVSNSDGLAEPSRLHDEERSGAVAQQGWLGTSVSQAVHDDAGREKAHEMARVRSAVTAIIQREVEALGREVMCLRR